ncbi:uncharacterized protein LOC142989267 [Genypterus blacodes]|uniref:uncharacterized protein LOC142989267 n=1 Tax=Genypterus blacodes TaxID=154954 RepID=UPI003F765554
MRTSIAWLLLQLFVASSPGHAEVILTHRTEGQLLELSCLAKKALHIATSLHLYYTDTQSQTTLLSMSQDGEVRVHPQHRGRLELSGRLASLQVNVTITHLQHTDTGLYVWELGYREENGSDRTVLGAQQVFLFVEGTGRPCQCSARYSSLLLTISTAAALLLLALSWLAIDKCVKAKHHHTPQCPVPIYEEMNRKQQSDTSPQNNRVAPSHLEEASFPVYANPNIIRQQQDNYYACPRQLGLRV